MTSKLDVVKAWLDVPPGDVEGEAAYLSDDFQWVDEDGKALMDKEAWIGMSQMLLASLKDWDYVVSDVRQAGDDVIMTGHFEGTHTADLDMSPMGMGVIPASGRKIVWPEQSAKVIVKDGKIVRLEPHGESTGIEGFVAPLMG